MDIIGLLRKLGILRYGTRSYKKTKFGVMPMEAFMDDIYDDNKDLVSPKKKKDDKEKKDRDDE